MGRGTALHAAAVNPDHSSHSACPSFCDIGQPNVELTENNFRHHPLRELAMKKTTVRERTQTGPPRCGPEYIDKLLQLADKAQRLALQISNESEVCRLAGRLCRLVQFSCSEFTEREVEAFAAARIFQIEDGNDLESEDPLDLVSLHCSLALASYHVWENLWNEKHPDRLGCAWEGQDFELMVVWRGRVRAMISKCGQAKVFSLSTEQYAAGLTGAAANEEQVEYLANWMSEVLYEGTTPSS
jgi:hypothetical protein